MINYSLFIHFISFLLIDNVKLKQIKKEMNITTTNKNLTNNTNEKTNGLSNQDYL